MTMTVQDASNRNTATDPPDLVLQFVGHPDEFDLERAAGWMRQSAGLRLLIVGGPWSLSAARNRHFEAAGLWITEDQFARRLAVELDAWEGARPPLPSTADRSEVFLAEAAATGSRLAMRVAVASPDDAFRAFCEDELRHHGATIETATASDEGLDALLLDADPAGPNATWNSLFAGDRTPTCPILLLSTIPWALPVPERPHKVRIASKFAGGAVWSQELSELLSRSA